MNPQETINQLGGPGLDGALAYCGGRNIKFSGKTNTLYVMVNGARGFSTIMTVKLEGNDTYTVQLLSINPRKPESETTVSNEQKDVYCDELQQVFENMYDNYINVSCNGFIPMGA